MRYCVCIQQRQLKTHYQIMTSHNELQNLQICFKSHPFTNQLKSYGFEYFQICKDLYALERDNLKHQTPFIKNYMTKYFYIG